MDAASPPLYALSASDSAFVTEPDSRYDSRPAARNAYALADSVDSPRVVLHHGVNFGEDGEVLGRSPPALSEDLRPYVDGPRFQPKRAKELPIHKMARARVKRLMGKMVIESRPDLLYDKFGKKRLVSQFMSKTKDKGGGGAMQSLDFDQLVDTTPDEASSRIGRGPKNARIELSMQWKADLNEMLDSVSSGLGETVAGSQRVPRGGAVVEVGTPTCPPVGSGSLPATTNSSVGRRRRSRGGADAGRGESMGASRGPRPRSQTTSPGLVPSTAESEYAMSMLSEDDRALPPRPMSVEDTHTEEALRRGATPMRYPPKLQQFWERHPELTPNFVGDTTGDRGGGKAGAGGGLATVGAGRGGRRGVKRSRPEVGQRSGASTSKLSREGHTVGTDPIHWVHSRQHNEGYTMHDFEIDASTQDAVTGADLPISIEMRARLTQSLSFDENHAALGSESLFWNSELLSTLSKPMDSSCFCSRDTQLVSNGTGIRFQGIDALNPRDSLENTDGFRYNSTAHDASSILQRWWKRRAALEQQSALRIQAWFRGSRIRLQQRVLIELQIAAAMLVQSLWRGNRGRVNVANIRRLGWNFCTTEFQRVWRGFLGREKARAERIRQQHRAAVIVQSSYRSLIARRKAEIWRLRRANWAAESIQMVWRWKNFRNHKTLYEQLASRSALKMQALFRGRRARVLAAVLRAARHLQRGARGYLSRRFIKLMHSCSTRVQALIRSVVQREWCRREKARILAEEAARRAEEDALSQKTAEDAIQELAASFKTKEGKKKWREELKRVRVTSHIRKKDRKVMTRKQRAAEGLKRAFTLFDVDGSGKVDADTFRRIAKECCVALNKDEAQEVANRSGVTTFDRMVMFLNMPKQRATQKFAGRRVRRLGLRIGKGCRDVFGFTLRRQAKRNVLAQAGYDARMQCREEFRQHRPPPFSCSNCSGVYSCAFTYQLERHQKRCGQAASRRSTFLGQM